jgi:hypothetical protein
MRPDSKRGCAVDVTLSVMGAVEKLEIAGTSAHCRTGKAGKTGEYAAVRL